MQRPKDRYMTDEQRARISKAARNRVKFRLVVQHVVTGEVWFFDTIPECSNFLLNKYPDKPFSVSNITKASKVEKVVSNLVIIRRIEKVEKKT